VIRYEKRKGLPPNYLNVLITHWGAEGAMQQLEMDAIDFETFLKRWAAELSDVKRGNQAYKTYCAKRKRGDSSVFSKCFTDSATACPSLPHDLQIDSKQVKVSIKSSCNALIDD
jgi:hypothetical protein